MQNERGKFRKKNSTRHVFIEKDRIGGNIPLRERGASINSKFVKDINFEILYKINSYVLKCMTRKIYYIPKRFISIIMSTITVFKTVINCMSFQMKCLNAFILICAFQNFSYVLNNNASLNVYK